VKTQDKIACLFAVVLMLFLIFFVRDHDEDLVNESFTREIAPQGGRLDWIMLETSGDRSYILVNDIEHEAVKFDQEKVEKIIHDFEAKKKVKVEKHVVDFFPNETGFFFKMTHETC